MSLDPTQQHLRTPEPTAPTDLGTCVAGLLNAVVRGMAAIVAPQKLTPLDFALLRLFLGREEWTTTQLGQVLPVALSGISRAVTKLVDLRLIRRRRLRDDRRIVMLALTEEGKSMTQELHQRVMAYDARLSEGIEEEEMAAFVSVTSRVMANYTALQTRRNGSH